MESSIWGKLPPELVVEVINQTEDPRDLKRWCSATCVPKYSNYYVAAMRKFHVRFHMNRSNFNSPDTARRRRFAGFETDERELRRALRPLPSGHHLNQPIVWIETLVLNLQTGYSKGSLFDEARIKHSVNLILNNWQDVKVLEQYGDLTPSVFRQVVDLVPSLEHLTFRGCNPYGPQELLGRYSDLKKYPSRIRRLPFEMLRARMDITRLEVGVMLYHEVASLTWSIRSLRNLEVLYITAGDEGVRTMTYFLSAMFVRYDGVPDGFPALLRRLKLVDNDDIYSESFSLGIRSRDIVWMKVFVAQLEKLEYLYLDLSRDVLVPALLERIRPVNITHLSLAIRSPGPVEQWGTNVWDPIEKDYCQNLQQLEVLNARNFPDYLTRLRASGLFTPSQVFIADLESPSAEVSETEKFDQRDEQPFREMQLDTRSLSFPNGQRRWGSGVECLRLDHWAIEDLTEDTMNDPSTGLQNLGVLMINDKLDTVDDDWVWTLDPATLPYDIFGRPIPVEKPLKEMDIANHIANLGPNSLQVIVVNGYLFWVRRAQDFPYNELPCLETEKAIPMKEALRNEYCARKIEETMTERRWSFVLEREPVLPKRTRPEFARAFNKFVFFL